jgi:hypothetical protein
VIGRIRNTINHDHDNVRDEQRQQQTSWDPKAVTCHAETQQETADQHDYQKRPPIRGVFWSLSLRVRQKTPEVEQE